MDLIEIILHLETKVFNYDQLEEAIALLKSLPSDIVLDLHGVLDTVSATTALPLKSISCCSFVGSHSPLRKEAAMVIKERIESGQIAFGVLVFKRHEKERYEIGTKSWYCLLVNAKMFFDDSFDHINYVKSYGIKSYHITV